MRPPLPGIFRFNWPVLVQSRRPSSSSTFACFQVGKAPIGRERVCIARWHVSTFDARANRPSLLACSLVWRADTSGIAKLATQREEVAVVRVAQTDAICVTHTHTHTHSLTHTQTLTHKHASTRARAHTHTHTNNIYTHTIYTHIIYTYISIG
jgi:hypothetical protein